MKIQINTYGKKIILMLNYCYLRFRLRRDMPMQWLLQYSMHTTTVVKEKHAWLIKKEMSERGGYGKTNYNIICIFDQKINKCICHHLSSSFCSPNQIKSMIHSFIHSQPNPTTVASFIIIGAEICFTHNIYTIYTMSFDTILSIDDGLYCCIVATCMHNINIAYNQYPITNTAILIVLYVGR